jgi:hypothetical protein
MARAKKRTPKVEEVRPYVEGVAKNLIDKLYGPAGPPGGTKLTEKFWSEQGAEALLQLRADQLSDDQPLDAFWQRRQEEATGQRRYRPAA